jgi:hypothetical protein
VTIGKADRVISYDGDGTSWSPNPSKVAGRWPTLSPRGDVYALSVVDAAAGRSRLEVRDAATHDLVATPYLSDEGGPAAIAPRVPHYSSWSRDGTILSYVAPTANGLTLFFARRDRFESPDAVLVGAPLFSAWLADSSALIVHHAADLSRVDAASGSVEPLSTEAVGFRAPASVPAARGFAYARRSEGELGVFAVIDGAEHRVATYRTGVVLGFRPGGEELSIATTADPSTGVFDRLESVDVALGHSRVLWRHPYVGFWWHPSGDRLVILVPTQMGDGRYALYSLDAAGALVTATAGFVPSEDTRLALGFFDQYAQSYSPWDASGSVFVISGRLLTDGVSSSFGDPVGDQVLTWTGLPGAPLATVGPGGIAGFAPGLA